MVLRHDTKWFWDSWYVHDGKRWHGYVLQADKAIGNPDLRHFNVSQGHAVSDDLVNWDYLGTFFQPSEGPAFDDYTTWTGSVVRGDDGLWHSFYTGASRADNGLYQRIGHATSDDLHTFNRVGDGLCLDMTGPNAGCYEATHQIGRWHDRAMRDPWVMKDPDGRGWLMYFTARVPNVLEPNDAGCIGFATSPDLYTWTLQPPVYRGGGYGQMEVPQVFQLGDRWYCLFCTSWFQWSHFRKLESGERPVTGNHYLMADHPRGPWRIAPGGFLDGDVPCRRYAARIVVMPDGPKIIGFADQPDGVPFVGEIMDPEPIEVRDDGTLAVRKA